MWTNFFVHINVNALQQKAAIILTLALSAKELFYQILFRSDPTIILGAG